MNRLNLHLQESNLKTQSVIKINKLIKQLYLNQMTVIFENDSEVMNNHDTLVKNIVSNIEICKRLSKDKQETDTLDIINFKLNEYNLFFSEKIIPYHKKQLELSQNMMSYSLADADETSNDTFSSDNKKNSKVTSEQYIQFLKDLNSKLEASRNQIDISKRNELNFSGGKIIEDMQMRIDTLEDIYMRKSDNTLKSVNDSSVRGSIILILVMLILGTYLSIIISNSITRPVKNIIQKMHLVETGDLNTYVEIDSSDEIGILGNSFNNMVTSLNDAKEEISAHQEELMHLNEVLTSSNEKLEKTNIELKQTHIQLFQSEKMASLGMLVAGIAHEINTPLGAINCNVDLYKILIEQIKNMPDIIRDSKIGSIIDKLDLANNANIIACERIMNIVKSLRSFARLDEAEFSRTNIHTGIDNTLVILNNKLKNRINIIKEYGEIPEVWCYPNQLNQIFLNLLVNASDAIPDRGNIWIRTYIENEKLFIKIKDDGTGIKAENLAKIFDPGFTTKGVGIGTGLGLSIVYRIMEKHNGQISVQSELGHGTEFTITIPIVEPENT